jgi:hypothetical protein
MRCMTAQQGCLVRVLDVGGGRGGSRSAGASVGVGDVLGSDEGGVGVYAHTGSGADAREALFCVRVRMRGMASFGLD